MCSPSAVRTMALESRNVDRVAGMHDAARRVANGLEVGSMVVARDVGVFAILAMIEKLADFDALDKIGDAAHVIDVEVSDQHMIDLRDASVVHRGDDAVGVAAIVARPSGIDEQRSLGRRNEQRRLPAFHVDGVDGEGPGGGLGMADASGRAGDQREHAQSGKQEVFHNRQSVSRTAHGAKPRIARNLGRLQPEPPNC